MTGLAESNPKCPLHRVAAVLTVFALAGGVAGFADDDNSTTVGMPSHIEQIVLPGSELEVAPIDEEKNPVVIRIIDVYPHGEDFRYDLAYYALEPGNYDLSDYLRRKDRSSTEGLPAIPVEVHPVLPPGQVEPNAITVGRPPFLGGYRAALVAGGILWFAGLLAILLVGRKRPSGEASDADRSVSLADRLRPLVEDAVAGKLTESEQAELERILLAFWRRRLQLEDVSAAEAMQRLRTDPDAGSLLRELEAWLHSPRSGQNVDVAKLLEPYQRVRADDNTNMSDGLARRRR